MGTNGNGAKTLTLNMLQRFAMENFLGEQKGTREKNRIFYSIRQKIKIPVDLRAKFMRDGREMGDLVFEGYEFLSVELEDEEARRLGKVLDEAELPAIMLDWVEPVLEQLGVL